MSRQARKLTGASILTAAFLLIVATAPVCVAGPPQKGSCEQTDPYERLKCRHDNVAQQIEYMANNVFADGTLLGNQLTEGQKGQLKSTDLKSKRARAKSSAEDFKKLAKSEATSNRNSCHLVPLDPSDADGICSPETGEKCAAIELDASGNRQECNPAKKNKGKGAKGGSGRTDGLECDQICDPAAALTGDEATQMQAEAEPMDKAYDSLESDLYQVNDGLGKINDGASSGSTAGVALVSGGSCSVPESTPGLDLADSVLRQLSVTARGLGGMANTGCQQVAVALGFGGNGSAACLTFQSAATVLEIAYVTIDEIRKMEAGAVQAATMSCLQKVQGDISEGFANLYSQHAEIKANDNANAAKIMNQIEQVRAEIVRLLNTPQGQRSEFPVK
jgi:hypothetical protein